MKKRKPQTTPRPQRNYDRSSVVVVHGLKAGDPSKLAPQPYTLANIAFELGRVDRKTFLAEAQKLVHTKQIMGRLFSFHKQELVDGGFLKIIKVPKDKWAEEQAKRTAKVAVLA